MYRNFATTALCDQREHSSLVLLSTSSADSTESFVGRQFDTRKCTKSGRILLLSVSASYLVRQITGSDYPQRVRSGGQQQTADVELITIVGRFVRWSDGIDLFTILVSGRLRARFRRRTATTRSNCRSKSTGLQGHSGRSSAASIGRSAGSTRLITLSKFERLTLDPHLSQSRTCFAGRRRRRRRRWHHKDEESDCPSVDGPVFLFYFFLKSFSTSFYSPFPSSTASFILFCFLPLNPN